MESRFFTQVNKVLEMQSGLTFNKVNGLLSGTIIIEENDDYQVEIDINPFPIRFPYVWETNERIHRLADRHIYTDKGNCCFTTRAREQILLKKMIKTLTDFVDLIVIPYFQNNSYYEIKRVYRTKEYSHGIFGIFQAYSDILDIKNMTIVLKLLNLRLQNVKFKSHEKCFCGSGVSIGNCHLPNYKELFMVDKEIIINDINNLIMEIKK